MLETLFGSINSERVLMFIFVRDEGYAREIARFTGADPDSIQKQLVKFESAGILVSRSVGRTRLFSYNPRYPFLKELRALLEKALLFYSQEDRERLLIYRRRPRKSGKPL